MRRKKFKFLFSLTLVCSLISVNAFASQASTETITTSPTSNYVLPLGVGPGTGSW